MVTRASGREGGGVGSGANGGLRLRRGSRRAEYEYELEEGQRSGRTSASAGAGRRGSAVPLSDTPLINMEVSQDDKVQNPFLDPPDRSPHVDADAEIRSVIFNQPLLSPRKPGQSGSSTPVILYDHSGNVARPAHSRRASEDHLSIFGGMATLRPSGAYVPVMPDAPSVPDAHVRSDSDKDKETQATYVEPSTTFSFLSLSQVSSPEVPTTMLGSWHMSPRSGMRGDRGLEQGMNNATVPAPRARSDVGEGEHDHDHAHDMVDSMIRSVPDMRQTVRNKSTEDDVLSLPDTASSYADAESYTPNTSGARSPTFPAFPQSYRNNPEGGVGAGELGLTFVRSPRGVPITLASLRAMEQENLGDGMERSRDDGIERGTRDGISTGNQAGSAARGPMSVISVSDSEAGRSDGEAL